VEGFNGSLIQVDSLVPIRQYSDDQRTALEVLNEMLDAGTSTGDRLVAYALRDDTIVITTETALGFAEAPPMLGADGRLKFGGGGYYPPGRLVYGQHVTMEGLMLFDSIGIRGMRGTGIYISESEYDAVTESISVQSEGSLDPWKALVTSRG
jgi:hypothetical protein